MIPTIIIHDSCLSVGKKVAHPYNECPSSPASAMLLNYENKAGGARRERFRTTCPFTVGVAGSAWSTNNNGRSGWRSSQATTSGEENADKCPMTTRAVLE